MAGNFVYESNKSCLICSALVCFQTNEHEKIPDELDNDDHEKVFNEDGASKNPTLLTENPQWKKKCLGPSTPIRTHNSTQALATLTAGVKILITKAG